MESRYIVVVIGGADGIARVGVGTSGYERQADTVVGSLDAGTMIRG